MIDDYRDLVHVDCTKIEESYPVGVVTIDPAIPEETRDDFKEAKNCISIGAKKATVTMCRRVL